MDLTGEKVEAHLNRDCAGEVAAARVCPPFRHRFARNADRLLNRFWDYPRALRKVVSGGGFDLYHLADHSYSQLVHELPPGRAVVTCHDLDTFRCLLDPAREPRPFWFRAMVRRVLSGFQQAAAVVCNTESTRRAVLDHGLIPPERLHVVPLGAHPECAPEPDPEADAEAARLLGPVVPDGPPDLLHVGSTIPRKRIDLLLEIVAEVRRVHPGARLIKAGGALTPEQMRQAQALGVAEAIVTLPFSFGADGAAAARGGAPAADLVLQPSEASGLIACRWCRGRARLRRPGPRQRHPRVARGRRRGCRLSPCGAPSPPGLRPRAASSTTVAARSPSDHARRAAGLTRARLFQWPHHARQLARIYSAVLNPE